MPRTIAITGNGAMAEAMRQINPDVVAAFPITPSTQIIEDFAKFVADGKVDTELVTVESEHENIKVNKVGDEIQIDIDDHGDVVKVRVPIKVAEAMLAGGEDELDVLAALRELAAQGEATLVTVDGEDEQIRVWVDTSMEGI